MNLFGHIKQKAFLRVVPFVVVLLMNSRLYAQVRNSQDATHMYVQLLKSVTDVMVNDVTSPVAASRYYAYITIAASETSRLFHKPTKAGSFYKGLTLPQPASMLIRQADETLTTCLVLLKMGERLLPSGYLVKNVADSFLRISVVLHGDSLVARSIRLADACWPAFIQWSRSDGFSRLNSFPRYTPLNGDAYWQPTGPVFMAPVEPYWKTLRPFLLDSATQFRVLPPAEYDTMRGSSFMQQLEEVWSVVNQRDSSQQRIAEFWDCNPFAVQQIGHVEFGLKKISPGGHWIGITGIACRMAELKLQETTRLHAMVSMTIADAFIACWEEKYRSNRIRPETAIRRLKDPRWTPLLQTPPFPEYVSGHSVCSNAAAVILEAWFGPGFSYADDTEIEFGLPERRYSSFGQAAAEASISRLYGGIHFRDAIEQGVWQGRKVGEWALRQFRQSGWLP